MAKGKLPLAQSHTNIYALLQIAFFFPFESRKRNGLWRMGRVGARRRKVCDSPALSISEGFFPHEACWCRFTEKLVYSINDRKVPEGIWKTGAEGEDRPKCNAWAAEIIWCSQSPRWEENYTQLTGYYSQLEKTCWRAVWKRSWQAVCVLGWCSLLYHKSFK